MPEQGHPAPEHPYHVTYRDDDDEEEEEEDLVTSETDKDALELKVEERLNAANGRAVATYEADPGVWSDLRRAVCITMRARHHGDRARDGILGTGMKQNCLLVCHRNTGKRRRKVRDGGGGYDEEANLEMSKRD